MTKYKFSVIIPIYNVEDYLEETIKSVINQTIGFQENIQLVLINDGSPDNSEKICLKYKELYPENIIYHKQKNAGVSAARNKGIKLAEGEFTTMLDSDDKWSLNAFENVYNAYLNHKDINLFSCKMVFFDKKKGDHPLNYKYKTDKVVNILEDYEYPQLSSSSIFIKTNILKNYSYESSIKFSEDNRLINEIIFDEQKMMMLKEPIYYYRKRTSGDSAIQTSSMKEDWYTVTPEKVYKYLINLSKKKFGKVIKYIQNLVTYELVWRVAINEKYEIKKNVREKYIKDLYEIIKNLDDEIIINNRFMEFPTIVHLLNIKRGDNHFNKIDFKEDKISIKGIEISKKNLGLVIIDQTYIRDNNLIVFGKLDTKFIAKKDFNIKLNNKKIDVEYYELTNDSNKETFDGNHLHNYVGIKFEVSIKENWKLGFYANEDYLYPRFKKNSILTENLYRSYHHHKNRTIVRKNHLICCQKRNIFKSFYYELRNDYNLLKIGNKKLLLARIVTKFYRLFKIRELWFISDRVNKADDNGEHFFKYMVKNHKNKNIYYVLTKDSVDYERLSKIGKVIDPNSTKFKLLFHSADYVVSSHAENYIFNPLGSNGEFIRDQYQFKYVFLQHGIIKDDLSPWLNVNTKKMDMFVTSATPEYESLLKYKYYFGPEVVKLTGLPRYDTLKEMKHLCPPKKQIMLSLTWRNGLASVIDKETGERQYNEDFKKSDYFNFLNSLMNDKKLLDVLKETGYKIRFIPHPNVLVQLKDFTRNEFVDIEDGNINYQKEFCENRILITDYSSVFFDFGYLNKPVIYYQSDREEFYKEQLYDRGYFDYEKMGFGPVYEKYDEFIDGLIKIIKNNGKIEPEYKERIEKFFKYTDTNNCERVYEEIIHL